MADDPQTCRTCRHWHMVWKRMFGACDKLDMVTVVDSCCETLYEPRPQPIGD